ncbi:MAG TPA: zf-HC2 domain-containing protein [Burkholderiales bacterium]|nr:zf-HC2 domain-containing protein [Burkholderiales bacterium]
MKPMLSCREVTQLVSEGMDRRLGLGERVALRLHFAICRSCANFNRQMGFLREATRQLADAENLRNP